jgi:hypothetical protein
MLPRHTKRTPVLPSAAFPSPLLAVARGGAIGRRWRSRWVAAVEVLVVLVVVGQRAWRRWGSIGGIARARAKTPVRGPEREGERRSAVKPLSIRRWEDT